MLDLHLCQICYPLEIKLLLLLLLSLYKRIFSQNDTFNNRCLECAHADGQHSVRETTAKDSSC